MLLFIKKHYLILSILAVALILRLVGIFYGYPLALVNDETPTLAASLKMIGTGSLRANAFQYYYPAGLAYVCLPFIAVYLAVARFIGIFGSIISELKEAVLLNLGYFVPAIRIASAVLGAASVFLVYQLGQKLFHNKTIGLLAAWFLAINFFHLANSHYGQTWTAQTFFILLVLAWSVYFYQKEKISWRDYFMAGVLIALAFSINFVGVISYFWFLLAHWLKHSRPNKFIKTFILNKNFWLTNLVFVLLVALVYYLNPFGLNNYFGRILNPDPAAKSYSLLSLASLKILLSYLWHGFIAEPILFLLAIPSAVLVWKKNRIAFYFLVPWLIIYLLFLAPLTNPMTRYLLPIVPLLAILIAFLLDYLKQKFSLSVKALVILVVILSLPSLVFSVLFDARMLKKDTRAMAYRWVIENIQSGSRINNLGVGGEMPLVENQEAVKLIEEKMPALYSTKRKYLASLADDVYPRPNYFIINYPGLVADDYNYEYLIVSDFDKSALFAVVAKFDRPKELIQFFYPSESDPFPAKQELELPFNLYSFNPWFLFCSYDHYGPYVEIYQLGKNN